MRVPGPRANDEVSIGHQRSHHRFLLVRFVAFDELHDEGVHAGGFLEPVDRGDVGMVQRRKRLRFALEPRQTLRVRGERIGQDLDRDLAAETGIGGAVDRAHAAFADRRNDFVDAESGAGTESQIAVNYMVKGA